MGEAKVLDDSGKIYLPGVILKEMGNPQESQKELVTTPLHRMEVKLKAHHRNPSKPSQTV